MSACPRCEGQKYDVGSCPVCDNTGMLDEYGEPFTKLPQILDACCGGRHWWWDKAHPLAVYMDERELALGAVDVRPNFTVAPDVLGDFREMPFPNESFHLVLFDPPHIVRELPSKSYIRLKYGALAPDTEQDDLRRGFAECWRVLAPGGTLVFKWGAGSIKRVEPHFPAEPIVGTRSPRGGQTRWFIFYKPLVRGGDAVGASRVLAGSESPPKTISAAASRPVAIRCDYRFDPESRCDGVYEADGRCDQCGRHSPRIQGVLRPDDVEVVVDEVTGNVAGFRVANRKSESD